MQNENPFLYNLLTPYDQIKFVNAFKTALKIIGKEKCWCMKKIKHSAFEGFNTSKKNKLQYQGKDARELLLYLTGRKAKDNTQIIVRKGYCQSPYCLNPAHYYWGTRKDVAYENASVSENSIDTFLISKLRKESQKGISSRKLSKIYRLPYHSVRRICSYETYEDAENRKNNYNEKEIWDNLAKICEKIFVSFPEESKKYKLNLLIPRTVQFTQNFSQFSYEENTNKNTLLAFYRIHEDGRREELPINDQGYVHKESAIDYLEDDTGTLILDYPQTTLDKGIYLILITNDIRYLETNYSISINVSVLDWRFIREEPTELINFGLITDTAESLLDFGSLI